ncbi:hypothetical protein, partial [Sutterella wadsworthensis]|uniref:hypothetical protein n=1 Tax=Sutterella wadsworthensis TaxID=40545 RepID=UPI003967C07B
SAKRQPLRRGNANSFHLITVNQSNFADNQTVDVHGTSIIMGFASLLGSSFFIVREYARVHQESQDA